MRHVHIHVTGIVQGVGMRPFVYREAMAHGICGWVLNAGDGVHVEAHASGAAVDGFVAALHKNEAVLTAAEAAEWRAGRSGGSTNTMNVYTQSLTESEIDYLFARFNREFGRAI